MGFSKFQPTKSKGLKSRQGEEVAIAGIGKCPVHTQLKRRPESGGKIPL